MLLNVVIQVAEGLDLLQVLYGNCDLVGELDQGNEVNQVNAVKVERLLQVCIGRELALFDFKLLSQQTVYLCDNFFSCFHLLL